MKQVFGYLSLLTLKPVFLRSMRSTIKSHLYDNTTLSQKNVILSSFILTIYVGQTVLIMRKKIWLLSFQKTVITNVKLSKPFSVSQFCILNGNRTILFLSKLSLVLRLLDLSSCLISSSFTMFQHDFTRRYVIQVLAALKITQFRGQYFYRVEQQVVQNRFLRTN